MSYIEINTQTIQVFSNNIKMAKRYIIIFKCVDESTGT